MSGRSGLLLREWRGVVCILGGEVGGKGGVICIYPGVLVFLVAIGVLLFVYLVGFSGLVSSVYTSVTICWKRGWTRRMADGHDGRRKRYHFVAGHVERRESNKRRRGSRRYIYTHILPVQTPLTLRVIMPVGLETP